LIANDHETVRNKLRWHVLPPSKSPVCTLAPDFGTTPDVNK